MCYSERASWLAFGAGTIGTLANAAFLIHHGRYSLLPFVASWITVIAMQIIEAFMYREPECTSSNSRRLRSAATIALQTQPVALTMGAGIGCLVERVYPVPWVIAVVVCVTAFNFGPSSNTMHLTPQYVPDSTSCVWRVNEGDYSAAYFAGMVAPALLLPSRWGALYAVLLVLSIAAGTMADPATWGSKWCHLAAFLPVAMLPASAANW